MIVSGMVGSLWKVPLYFFRADIVTDGGMSNYVHISWTVGDKEEKIVEEVDTISMLDMIC